MKISIFLTLSALVLAGCAAAPERYAVSTRFGSVGQAELIVGAPDENGARESFLLQTPAENSFVYSELEPTC